MLRLADLGDTTTMKRALASAAKHLAAMDAAPTFEAPGELIADKKYHSRDGLKALDSGPWKSRIFELHRDRVSRWHGDDAARRAVYNNQTRLHAPCLAARPAQHSEALPDPRCRIQSWLVALDQAVLGQLTNNR